MRIGEPPDVMPLTTGRTNRIAAAAAMAALGALACWSVPEVDRRIVMPWLLCTDCTSGELDRVLVYGARVVPTLLSALHDGPTHAEDSVTALSATEGVLRARRYRVRHGGVAITTADSLESVQRQLDNFQLTYRLRAAQALVRIDPLRAATAVDKVCSDQAQALNRRPEFKVSFKAIGACP